MVFPGEVYVVKKDVRIEMLYLGVIHYQLEYRSPRLGRISVDWKSEENHGRN